LAALRTAAAARRIRAGAVLTRDGCVLGVEPGCGATIGLSWAEISGGVLLTGSDERTVLLAGQQVVHAALRLRKAVFLLGDDEAGLASAALAAACRATGTPLPGGAGPGRLSAPAGAGSSEGTASRLWGRGPAAPAPDGTVPAAAAPAVPEPTWLRRVIGERSAAILPASSTELAALACDRLARLAANLRRIGADGDALIWVPRAELIPAPALAALLREGAAAGLGALTATTVPGAAANLGRQTAVTMIGRIADPALAAGLAPLTGTRLIPVAVTPSDGALSADASSSALVPAPAVSARELLALGPAEFVLAVSAPQRRLVRSARLVPARLPCAPGGKRPARADQ
jgi:hypothetical protein